MYIALRSVGISPKRNLVYLEEIKGSFRSILVKNAFSLLWTSGAEQNSMFSYWKDYIDRSSENGKKLMKVLIERDTTQSFSARVIWSKGKAQLVENLEPWIAVLMASQLKRPILIKEEILEQHKMSAAELEQNAIETVDEMRWKDACHHLFNDLRIFNSVELNTLLQSTIRREDSYGYAKVIAEYNRRLGGIISE